MDSDECGVAIDEGAASQEQKPPLCFKQRAEKSTGGEVTLLEWSPTMDILALAFADHSVSVKKLKNCSISSGVCCSYMTLQEYLY